mgnify:CR=1 FL=1
MAHEHGIQAATDRLLPRREAAPLIFGHRGYSAIAPENTLPAFEAIRSHEVPGVELDVQRCASGEIVVSHDENLERVAGVDLRIEDAPYEELRKLDVGSWFADSFTGERLPLLEEVLDLLRGDVVYDIELKTRHTGDPARHLVESVLEVIERFDVAHTCILSSFNPFALRWSRRRTRRIPTALIYTSAKDAPLATRFSASQRILGNELLKPDRQVFSRESGRSRPPYPRVPRLVWTVDDPHEKQQILEGLPAEGAAESAQHLPVYGVISNDPAGAGEGRT